jgi:hypothetical protein
MIAKDPRSTYRSSSTRSWMKVKVRHEGVFVVGGIRDVNAFDGGRACGRRTSIAASWSGASARRRARPAQPRAAVVAAIVAVRGALADPLGDVGRTTTRGGSELRGDRRGAAEGAELASPRQGRGCPLKLMLFAEHPAFEAPEDPPVKIWRFMSVAKSFA